MKIEQRDKLLDVAGLCHVRKLIRSIYENEDSPEKRYYNTLCTTLKIPKATAKKYLDILCELNILDVESSKIKNPSYSGKGHTPHNCWVTIYSLKNTPNTKELIRIIKIY